MKQTFKRWTALILALSMCLSLLCSIAWAAEVTETDGNAVEAVVAKEALKGAKSGTCGKNLTWKLDDAGTLTISGTGAMTNWNWDVESPWDYNEDIYSVILENGITSIGNYAFYGCSNLSDITIPDGITRIGDYAFDDCVSLSKLVIPDSVTKIGDGAFSGCSNLTSAGPIGSGCDYEFGWTTSIPANAFWGCDNLASVTIPKGVTKIGDFAFADCENLAKVTIPTGVTVIGDFAFSDCSGLTSISIPRSVTKMGFGVFSDCNSLTTAGPIGSGCRIEYGWTTVIPEYAFSGCTSLTSITIPSNVTTIGDSAFEYCESLTKVTIPSSVTSIGYSAFDYCERLTHVYYGGTKEQWKKIKMGDYNNYLTNSTIHYASSSTLKANTITASNFTKTYSTKAQSFSIGATCKGSAKLSYSSSNSKVKVTSAGKVTIPAKFMGKVTITITSAATGTYAKTTKKITVTVNPTKTTLSSVTNAKGLKMTVKWAKNTVGTGYEIQYSTKKDFSSGVKSVTIGKNSTVSKTITGLTKGKTYYVRIRTYKTVSSVKYYSGWSAVKSVKISK